jgi:hypothetical protein
MVVPFRSLRQTTVTFKQEALTLPLHPAFPKRISFIGHANETGAH